MSQLSTAHSADERKPRAGGRRLLSFADLHELKGITFSRVWLTKLIKAGKFPRPVKPGAGGIKPTGIPVKPGVGNINAWFEDEIDAYLDELAAARDNENAA